MYPSPVSADDVKSVARFISMQKIATAQENCHGTGKLQRHCLRFFCKNYRPFACPVSNVCNYYQKLFTPFAVSLLYFGYCAVNGAFVPVARQCRCRQKRCWNFSMQKIATAQENCHGAGKLPWYRKITTALRAFLLQKLPSFRLFCVGEHNVKRLQAVSRQKRKFHILIIKRPCFSYLVI